MAAEFIACYEASNHGVWLRNFITGLRIVDGIEKPLMLFCNNKLAILYSNNNRSSTKPRHIDIKFLVVKERIQSEQLSIEHIGTNSMIADPLTKGLPPKIFHEHTATNAKLAIGILQTIRLLPSGLPIPTSPSTFQKRAGYRNNLVCDTALCMYCDWSSVGGKRLDDMHAERRLHQMMFADRDYERDPIVETCDADSLVVSVQDYFLGDYSVVNIHCKDRTDLLYDLVCTLTDIEYVVFHATGVRLELCTSNRKGLLAHVTRTFRENGLNVTRAEILMATDTVLNIFYMTDGVGNRFDLKIIESVREKTGSSDLKVKELPLICHQKMERGEGPMTGGEAMLLSLGSLVRRNLHNLGLIKSYSWFFKERMRAYNPVKNHICFAS
ncbi:act domain-containing protein acr8 [Phtheirospermum japonicum]|uniref:ACT domain-containing protein ACR n=1 Tax=Phtheirospermum japonicum TaxID=374723 RepID=A0A830BCI8_9LAMI|nr:act domain-containing protein acr8 [Phtheirospermum japonicum]